VAYHNAKFRWFVARPWAVAALIVANVVVYLKCVWGTEALVPDAATVLRLGAITAGTVADHQYWRLLAAGFLHFNPGHLAANMVCLSVWGSALENRIGTLYFLVIYFLSLLGGSLVSVLAHHTPFIGAGASGAISGVVGALLCLSILDKIEVSLMYMGSSLAVNATVSAVPGVDWRAHFGGFCAGLIVCAVLDVLVSVTRPLFRCRIPEFMKVNTAILAGVFGIRIAPFDAGWPDYEVMLAEAGIAFVLYVVALKLIDGVLVLKKGLMFCVSWLAALNALAVLAWRDLLLRMIALLHQEIPGGRNEVADLVRGGLSQMLQEPVVVTAGAVAVALCATLVAYRFNLRRGWDDVGFVGSSFKAERNRVRGL